MKGEHFVLCNSPEQKEADMKKLIAFTILAVFLAACAPIIPGSGGGAATPIVMTAEVSTVVAATVGTPPTEGPFPTPAPPTPIPTLPSSALSPPEL